MTPRDEDEKIDLLKRVPLFEGCSREELAQVALLADELNLPDGYDLTHQGSAGADLVVFIEGEADVIRDGNLVAGIGPGQFVGEIALVTGQPRTATVRTRGVARVLALDTREFRKLMGDVPSIQAHVLTAVALRLPQD